jgi:hypothetical protein
MRVPTLPVAPMRAMRAMEFLWSVVEDRSKIETVESSYASLHMPHKKSERHDQVSGN